MKMTCQQTLIRSNKACQQPFEGRQVELIKIVNLQYAKKLSNLGTHSCHCSYQPKLIVDQMQLCQE